MKYAVLAAQILLAIAFLFSAYTKWVAPGFFELTLVDQGVFDDRGPAAYFARFVIGLEIAIGIGFLQPFWIKRLIAPGTILLLLAFTGQLIYLVAIGKDDNCGCFGEMISMTPMESIFKNIILLGLAVFVFLKAEINMKKVFIPLGILVSCIVASYAFLPIKQIPLNAETTETEAATEATTQSTQETFYFSKFKTFEGAGDVNLAEGEKLIGVFNTNCDHCQAAATELGKSTNDKIPALYALFYNEIEEIGPKEFGEKTGTNYPYVVIGDDDFWGLLKSSPPVIYYVKDGKIVEWYDGDEAVAKIEEKFK